MKTKLKHKLKICSYNDFKKSRVCQKGYKD